MQASGREEVRHGASQEESQEKLTLDLAPHLTPLRQGQEGQQSEDAGPLIGRPPDPFTELQRARILRALMEVLEGRGFAGTTVGLVSRRAGVSTRTFFGLFGRLEDCVVAMMDDGVEIVARVILEAFAGESFWIDGVRSALAGLLILFDADPLQARVWQLETLAAGDWALQRRERNLALLRSLIVKRWYDGPDASATALASDGVMAAVLGVIQSRLLNSEDEPLLALLGPLMRLVVAPFVDTRVRAREIHRGDQLARSILEGRPPSGRDAVLCAQHSRLHSARRTLGPLPPRCSGPQSRRARECLALLAERPESSNREVAAAIGIAHQSQISRLLSGLLADDLVVKRSEGVGRRNAWRLTPRGEEIARAPLERGA